MKKTAAAILCLICLISLGVVNIRPVKAQYQGDITINTDGSVSPSSAPIQRAGNVYTLASDVNESIVVQRNNTIIDGAGYTVFGFSLKEYGLSLSDVSNVTVKNCIITQGNEFAGAFIGILLSDTSNVVVTNNTITGIGSPLVLNEETYIGIDVEGSSHNVFAQNDIANNIAGIYFSYSSNNLIIGNNITETTNPWGACTSPGGINFDHGANNTIYHNNFIIGFQAGEAAVSNSVNVWDDGYPSGGNYWGDYKGYNPKEIGNSGIGNLPYLVGANNTDRYPLMEPFTNTFYASQTTPPKVSLLSPLKHTYNESRIALVFSVDVLSPVKSVSWAGYSLDGKQYVTITGNTTLTGLSSGLHKITVYANDTYGNTGVSQTVSFTIAKPFPTATVAVVLAAVIVVVGISLWVYFKKRKGDREP